MAYNLISGPQDYLTDRLNGTVRSKNAVKSMPALDGLTLIFNRPAVTVTFSAPADYAAIVDQINTAVRAEDPGFQAKFRAQRTPGRQDFERRLALIPGDEGGVELSHTGTANALLGLPTTADDPELSGYRVDRSTVITAGDTMSAGSYVVHEGEGAVLHHQTDHSTGPEITNTLLTRGGGLIEAIVVNRESSTVYFQLHDRDTALSGGEAPRFSIPVMGEERISLTPASPYPFETGIVFGFSSAPDTYTPVSTGGVVYSIVGF